MYALFSFEWLVDEQNNIQLTKTEMDRTVRNVDTGCFKLLTERDVRYGATENIHTQTGAQISIDLGSSFS